MSAKLPDALADALGRVIAEERREWQKEAERMAAESRAVIAELRADLVEVKAELKAAVDRELERIAAIPLPKDGKDGADGKDGRDGLDAVSFVRDEGGGLIVVMSDGSIRDLGRIVGESGKDGKDGLDGVSFDDMDITLSDDERTLTISAQRGENRKEWTFRLGHVLDRGVFREGEPYAKGDGVTWGGSFWIAQEDTAEKPDSGNGWRLAVKRGRDGKDGVVKEASKPEPVRVGKPKGDK